MSAEFDQYGGRYEQLIQDSISFSGREHGFFLEAKAVWLTDLVRRRLGRPAGIRAVDVGCGTGVLHPYLAELDGELVGVDPSAKMLERARAANPSVRYEVADGRRLPFPDGAFDFAFTICVLHHVEPTAREGFVSELARVTRPGGLVAVVEHNPLNPLTRLAVHRCEFDEDAVLLGTREAKRRLAAAGLRVVESRYFLVFPWRGRLVASIERTLAGAPLGAQYCVAAHA